MAKQLTVENFLKLPDWKKVELKKKKECFSSMPLMTEEEKERRTWVLFEIAAHFNKKDVQEIIDSGQDPLDLIPYFLKSLLFPKLLDMLYTGRHDNMIKELGICYTCTAYECYSGLHYKKIVKRENRLVNKVITFSGICYMKKGMKANNGFYVKSIFPPHHACSDWGPKDFFNQLFMLRLNELIKHEHWKYLLKDNGNYTYTFDDYIKDFKTIDISNFFNNVYYAGMDKDEAEKLKNGDYY